MAVSKNILKFSKWSALFILTCFLIANIVLAIKGVISILLFSVVFAFTFLLVEICLSLIRSSTKTRSNVRTLIVSIIIGVLIGEISLRVWGKYDSYREKKGEFFYNVVYEKTNLDNKKLFEIFNTRLSLTNPSYKEGFESKAEDEFRILGVGDSFTEGIGTSNDSTWLKLLETRLNEGAGLKRIKTFNAGISGNDPFFEYILLKEKLLAYQPDLIIVAINNSDISETIVRGGPERFLPDSTIEFREGPWYETLFGMSYICRVFVIEVLKYDWLFLTPEERKREESAAIDKIYLRLLQFGQLAKENDLNILLVFHPMIEEVVSGNMSFDETIEKLSTEPHLKVLNLLDYFLNEENMSSENVGDYYWENDKHHNSRGYELFAKGIEKNILKMQEYDVMQQRN